MAADDHTGASLQFIEKCEICLQFCAGHQSLPELEIGLPEMEPMVETLQQGRITRSSVHLFLAGIPPRHIVDKSRLRMLRQFYNSSFRR
jgi:hypothetical protein